jgi:hypothetical protein
MNVRALISMVVGVALAVAIVAVALMIDQPADGPPGTGERPPRPAAADAGNAAREQPSRPAADEMPVGQLLRTTERAHIAAVALDHDPAARGTTVRLAVEVAMQPGMHVNANPPSEDWLIPVQASVAGVDGVQVIDAYYPEAEEREFPYGERPFRVYEDSFVIGLVLAIDGQIPAGGRRLEVLLDYQACNDEACFAPAQTSTALDIMVVADAADARETSSPILERAPFPR